ncbi:MAG: hypothetical protein AAF291_07935 [Pseudomonadota bacterium]
MSTQSSPVENAACNAGLIGHTGFVGSTLARQTRFAAGFNSATISESAGAHFDTLVCAAAPGSMLEANTAPEVDRAKIHALINHLSRIKADRFVLISSIAVLAEFAGGDDEGTRAFQTQLAYGKHRRELEAFVEDHFADHLIVRLPALFGQGLRKNFIFDLMNPVPSMLNAARLDALIDTLPQALSDQAKQLYAHPDPVTGLIRLDRAALNASAHRRSLEEAVANHGFSAVGFHNPATTYQYYEMARLWSDIGVALEHGLTHLHLVAHPLETARIHQEVLGRAMPDSGARLHREDMRTRHADLWGARGPYQFSAEATLDSLAAFVAEERAPA